MHKLLENALVKKHAKLFKNYGGDPRETCMHWGMSCGKGWFLLIDELCSKLDHYDVVAAQVKEKFGSLRFYLESSPSNQFDEIHKHISEFEVKSGKTCETCGAPGTRRNNGWIKCICDKCVERASIFSKMRDSKYAYSLDEPGHIVIFNPETDEEIFSGTISEFMKIIESPLGLIEDPMRVDEKPLWEQI